MDKKNNNRSTELERTVISYCKGDEKEGGVEGGLKAISLAQNPRPELLQLFEYLATVLSVCWLFNPSMNHQGKEKISRNDYDK